MPSGLNIPSWNRNKRTYVVRRDNDEFVGGCEHRSERSESHWARPCSYNTRTTRRAPTSAYHCRRKLGFIAHHRYRLLRRQPETQPFAQPCGLLDAPSGLSGLTVVAEVGGHCCVGGWRAGGRGCPDETPSSSRTVEPVVVSVRWVPVPAGGDRVGRCAGICGSDCPTVTSRNCLPSVVSSWIT